MLATAVIYQVVLVGISYSCRQTSCLRRHQASRLLLLALCHHIRYYVWPSLDPIFNMTNASVPWLSCRVNK